MAARRGDSARVGDLFDNSEIAPYVNWAIFAAVVAGKNEIVALAAERFGNSVLHDRHHLALRMAARKGNLSLFRFLLAHDSRIDACGFQALKLAQIHGHDEIVEECIRRGAPLLTPTQFANFSESVAKSAGGPLVFLQIVCTGSEVFETPFSMVFGFSERLEVKAEEELHGPDRLPTQRRLNDGVRKSVSSMSSKESSAVKLLSGQYSFRIREALPPSRLFFSLVSDPVNHVAVLFNSYIAPVERGLSAPGLSAAFDSPEILLKYGYLLKDHQTRVLSGNASFDPDNMDAYPGPPAIGSDDLDQIFADIGESFLLLGQRERIEDCAIILARQMGLPLTVMLSVLEDEYLPDISESAVDKKTREHLLELNAMDVRLHQWAGELMDKNIAIDPEGFERDRQILHRLKQLYDNGEPHRRLLQIEEEERELFLPRLDYLQPAPFANKVAKLHDGAAFSRSSYLDLMEDVLINRIYADPSLASWNKGRHNEYDRTIGNDWPEIAHTMVGKKRIHNVRLLCEKVIRDEIPGDFIETGVWRGGATIMMRAVLHIYNNTDRTVWVADSFSGVPPPDAELYPADVGDVHFTATELGVTQAEVARNFRKYGLLDRQVRFLPGLFSETLQEAPIKKLAILRLDGDMFESTMDALDALYDRLSVGGYVIVDDYEAVPGCKKAITLFREREKINSPLMPIDWAGVYWCKTT